MNDRERRVAERIRLESRIVIKTENDIIGATACSRNISIKGIYLVPEKKLPLETPCTLDIFLTGQTSKMIVTVAGKVCRHDDEGMGIAFLDMEVDSFVHIKNLINLHNGEGDSTDPATAPNQQPI